MIPGLADILFSFYIGASQTRPSNLHVVQPSRGNDATIHDVTWHGYPFRFEIYYGLRITYSPPYHPWTRIALDYTHAKVYAESASVVPQDGIWHGSPLHDTAPMRERVQSFEITHGLNLLGINVMQQLTGPDATGLYVGGGPLLFFPHSENRVDGLPGGDGYEYGGLGFQALAGARGCIGARPLFSEVKYSHGTPSMTIAQGRARVRLDTIHELAGIDLRPCP